MVGKGEQHWNQQEMIGTLKSRCKIHPHSLLLTLLCSVHTQIHNPACVTVCVPVFIEAASMKLWHDPTLNPKQQVLHLPQGTFLFRHHCRRYHLCPKNIWVRQTHWAEDWGKAGGESWTFVCVQKEMEEKKKGMGGWRGERKLGESRWRD